MTRDEFDIACKLAIGFTLEEQQIYYMKGEELLVIYGFTETGIKFHIQEEQFFKYNEFMDIVNNVTGILDLDNNPKRLSAIDIVNAYDTTGMIPFIYPDYINKIVP